MAFHFSCLAAENSWSDWW